VRNDEQSRRLPEHFKKERSLMRTSKRNIGEKKLYSIAANGITSHYISDQDSSFKRLEISSVAAKLFMSLSNSDFVVNVRYLLDVAGQRYSDRYIEKPIGFTDGEM
jgi:hypothetical protein